MSSEDIFLFAGAAAALIHASVRFAMNYREKKAEDEKLRKEKLNTIEFILHELNAVGFGLSTQKAAEYLNEPAVTLPEDVVERFPNVNRIVDQFVSLFEDEPEEGRKIVNAVILDAMQNSNSRSLFNNLANAPLHQRIDESYLALSKGNYVSPTDIALNKQLSAILASDSLLSDYSTEFIISLIKWLNSFLTIRHHASLARGQLHPDLKAELNALIAVLNNPKLDIDSLPSEYIRDIQLMKLDISNQAQNIKALAATYAEIMASPIDTLEPEVLLVVYPVSALLGKWDDVRAISKKLTVSHPDFLDRFKHAAAKMRNIPDMSVLYTLAEDFDFYNYCYATSTSEEEIQENAIAYMKQYHVERKAAEAAEAKRKAEREAAKKAADEAAAKKAADEAAEKKAIEDAAAAEAEATKAEEVADATEEVPQAEDAIEVSEETPKTEEQTTEDVTEATEETPKTEEAVEAEDESPETEEVIEDATEKTAESTEEASKSDEQTTEVVEEAPKSEEQTTEVTEETAEGSENTENTTEETEAPVEEEEYVPVVGGIAYDGPSSGPHPLTLKEYGMEDYSFGEWDIRELIMDTVPERIESADADYLKSLRDDMNRSNQIKAKSPRPSHTLEPGSNVIRRMGCLVTMKSFSPVPIFPIGIWSEDKMVLAMKVNIPSSLKPLVQSEYYELVRDNEYVDTENNTQAWNGFMTLKQQFTSTSGEPGTKTSFFFNIRIIIAPKKKGLKAPIKGKAGLKGKAGAKKPLVKSGLKSKKAVTSTTAPSTTAATVEVVEDVPEKAVTETTETVEDAETETPVSAPVETEAETEVAPEVEIPATEETVTEEVAEVVAPVEELAEEPSAPIEEVVEESVAPVEEAAEVVAEDISAPVEEAAEVVAEDISAPVEEATEVVADEASAPVEEDIETAEESSAPVEEDLVEVASDEPETSTAPEVSDVSDSTVVVDSDFESSSIVVVDPTDAEEQSESQ